MSTNSKPSGAHRWSNLSLAEEERARLPGYREDAVVRHFDAPEALDTRFYEVRAKSILNHVPPASQMPFRWTINPYRGCSHACTYCLDGDTRVLCADGCETPIRDLDVGTRIVGTRREGRYRRFVETEVLDKWSSIKPAFLIELDDGTELIASGDHRFLSSNGWSYVTEGESAQSRQRLVVGIQLLGRDSRIVPVGSAPIGSKVEGPEGLRVRGIRDHKRTERMYDITTGTGDFLANGVISHNCFARPTHKYLDFDAGRDFEREIVVKVNAPELLRIELAKPSWKGEHVALGTNTDPYQWVEGRYKLMPGIWEAMRDFRNPCSILTKSPLLLRDLELMREINERTEFSAALSIPTLEEKAWRATEPRTPNPRARLEAVAELSRAAIRTGVLIAPLMPGVNDSPGQVQEIVDLAMEAGAAYATPIALHLRGEVKPLFFEWLAENRPDLVPRYRQLYRRGAYAPQQERERLASLVNRQDPPFGGLRRGGRWRSPEPEPEPEDMTEEYRQEALF